MNNTIIEVKNLSYVYTNDTHALNNISVKINKGERVAVLGTNGAGKSTFFLNLNGVLTPHSGSIYFNGQEIKNTKADLMELRKNVGIVFQDADNQIIASTVLGEVSFGPMNLKLPKEEVISRVNTALNYMNLEDFKSRPPHYLSGGEKKRVSIADIIAMNPQIIIFDEPTASLDPINCEVLENTLDTLHNEGITMLVSTHDVNFAYRWAERILVFSNGSIIADGSPQEIFTNDKILTKANLKKPILLDVYEILLKNKMINDINNYPKDIDSFNRLINLNSESKDN